MQKKIGINDEKPKAGPAQPKEMDKLLLRKTPSGKSHSLKIIEGES